MKLWKRPVVALLMRLNQTFWRDVHEDTCGARFCGGWRCCTCTMRGTPDYVRRNQEKKWGWK